MAFALTEEQQYAVDTLNVNCIVPAGAGSGKTRVLVERYLKIIEELSDRTPGILENIIAITFTEKAAKEMLERVRKGMLDRRENARVQGDQERALLWHGNLQKLDRASISTIHSFCAKILREFPIEARIDPDFTVLDATESEWILSDIIEQELKKAIELEQEKDQSPFYQWVITAGFKRVVSQLIRLFNQISNSGLGMEQIKQLTERSFALSPTHFLDDLGELLLVGDELCYTDIAGNKKLKEFQGTWATLKEQLKNMDDHDTFVYSIKRFIELTSGNFGTEVKELRKRANDKAKEFEEWTKAIPFHSFELEQLQPFFLVLERVEQSYLVEKDKLNGVDFDELQSRTIQLLRENKEVREKLQKRITFLMIDEFQDNNQIQKNLLDLLLKRDSDIIPPGSLFVVGDPKQSIYRFRGADVHVFKEMEKEILAKAGRVAPLIYNFRSEPRIIDFVNMFFGSIMSEDPTSPNFYKEAIAKQEIHGIDEVIEYIPVMKDEDEEEGIREIEAGRIADRIQELIETGVPAKNISILFRSLSHVGIYEEALQKRDIPYYIVGGRGFYRKQEIQDLTYVLEYIVDPTNKIALAGILRSPMVGISDETLYTIVRSGFFNRSFKQWELGLEDVSEEEKDKLLFFVEWLRKVSEGAGRIKVGELLQLIVELTSYDTILLALNHSIQAVANIEKLIRMAKNFPGDNPYSVYDFTHKMKRLKEEDLQEKEAAIESEAGNTVKLMTIHQSKGLEFPYVFVPDLSRKPINDDSLVRFDSIVGLTCKIPVQSNWEIPLRWLHVTKKAKRLDREEDVRVFYVAATRAEKKLILSGKVEDTKGKFDIKDVLKADSWGKWLDIILSYGNISYEEKIWLYPLKQGNIGKIKVVEPLENNDLVGFKRPTLEIFSNLDETRPTEKRIVTLIEPLHAGYQENIYSISSLKRYQTCPRYYYLSDRLSLYDAINWVHDQRPDSYEKESFIDHEELENVKKLSPAVKGTFVHELLEELTVNQEGMNKWQEVFGQILERNGFILEDVLELEEWKSFKEEVNLFIAHYSKSGLLEGTANNQIKTEYDFILPLKNGKIHGTIDRLDIHSDNTFTIIDYKTDKEIDRNKYRSQILTYSLAIMEILKLKPKKGIIYFIRHNKQVEIPLSQEILLTWKDELDQLLEQINQALDIEDFEKHIDHCKTCDFNRICENI